MKIPKKIKPWLLRATTIASGAVLPLAFAPFKINLFAFISPIILLSLLTGQSVKQAFWRGWQFGLGLFAVGSSWIYVSIYEYGNTNIILAIGITTLFVILLALFYATMAASLNALTPKFQFSYYVLAFPSLWVFFEMLRSWLFTGFPWMLLGYSQLQTHLSNYAPLGSVWSISLVVAMMAGISFYFLYLLHAQIKKPFLRGSLILLFFALWVGGYLLQKVSYTTPIGSPIKVALVQGNIPQALRWDPDAIEQIIETYKTLTIQNVDASVIIWPESAIPVALPYSNNLYQAFGDLAKNTNTAILAGVPEKVNGKKAYYNSLLGIGLAKGLYRKQHLVPFGEYVPLEKYIRGAINFLDLPMSRFIPSHENQHPVTAFGYRFGPSICSEITYPLLVRKMAKQSDILLTVSNDAWFGSSIGPDQHLQIAQFRALEAGRYLLRATNTGLTAIISPKGKIIQLAPQFTKTVLRGTATPRQGETPWIQWGIWPLLSLLSIMLIISILWTWYVPSQKHQI